MPKGLNIHESIQTKADAVNYYKGLFEDYKKNPRLSLNKIVEREREKGYKIWYNQLYRWMHKLRVKPKRYESNPIHTSVLNIPLTEGVHSTLTDYPIGASTLARYIIEAALGYPSPNFFMLRLAIDKPVFFTLNKNELYAMLTSDFTESEVKLVQGVTQMARRSENPIQYLKTYAESSGFIYLGGV